MHGTGVLIYLEIHQGQGISIKHRLIECNDFRRQIAAGRVKKPGLAAVFPEIRAVHW